MPNLRPRCGITCGHRIVDVKLNTRVTSLVRTRKANKRARRTTTPVLDLELSTRDIELRAAGCRSTVKADMFDTEEVFT